MAERLNGFGSDFRKIQNERIETPRCWSRSPDRHAEIRQFCPSVLPVPQNRFQRKLFVQTGAQRVAVNAILWMNLGIEMDIAAGPGTLCEIQAALDAFWSRHDHVPSRVRMEVGIAAAEIAANILEHCCVVSLRMELWVLADEVQVEFIDSGDPVAVDLDSVCMPDEMAERGRGLAMAQAALRLLTYFRDEVGNHWKLVSKAFSFNAHPVNT